MSDIQYELHINSSMNDNTYTDVIIDACQPQREIEVEIHTIENISSFAKLMIDKCVFQYRE